MVEGPSFRSGFLSSEENDISQRFLQDGYIISAVEDDEALDRIRNKIVELTSEYLGLEAGNSEKFLNQLHDAIGVDRINDFRLNIIGLINSYDWFRECYFSLARNLIETIVGNELAMQLRVNLSIQIPEDSSSLLPVHADVWSGNSPFEAVLWVPLVDCYSTKTMFLLPPAPTKKLHKDFIQFKGKSSEDIFREIESDLEWIKISFGQILLFNQNLPHGNRVNKEMETRWSMNCRFKSIFSPYGDKKLGEYFEPITLRAASRIGLTYQLPGESE